jgi:hypothetical protein
MPFHPRISFKGYANLLFVLWDCEMLSQIKLFYLHDAPLTFLISVDEKCRIWIVMEGYEAWDTHSLILDYPSGKSFAW